MRYVKLFPNMRTCDGLKLLSVCALPDMAKKLFQSPGVLGMGICDLLLNAPEVALHDFPTLARLHWWKNICFMGGDLIA